MKLLDKFCSWYMDRKRKTAQAGQKKLQDKKLEEAGDKLKALYEFVRFINEKCLRNRHERKTFWRNVSEGQTLVEDTIINVLRQMGVKEESIKTIQDEKVKMMNRREEAEKTQKLAKEARAKGAIVQQCPADCTNDCSKCANKPQPSESKVSEDTKKG